MGAGARARAGAGNAFNFARVVTCGTCLKHVDEKTRYVTNRLKEIKYERFKAYFKGDEDGLDKRAPNLERVQAADPMRARGSFTTVETTREPGPQPTLLGVAYDCGVLGGGEAHAATRPNSPRRLRTLLIPTLGASTSRQ